jgi:hypothetical protein
MRRERLWGTTCFKFSHRLHLLHYMYLSLTSDELGVYYVHALQRSTKAIKLQYRWPIVSRQIWSHSLKLLITSHTELLIFMSSLPSFCTSLYLLFSGHARMRIHTKKNNVKKYIKRTNQDSLTVQVFIYRCNITKEYSNKRRTEAIALYVALLSIKLEGSGAKGGGC